MTENTTRLKSPDKNLFLASLSPRSFSYLVPHLEYVELPRGRVIQDTESGNGCRFAHFLNNGMVSLVIGGEDGRSAEVGVVGKESMTGMAGALGLPRTPVTEMIQIGGSGYRIRAARMADTLKQSPEIRELVTRHLLFQSLQMAQVAACNALHTAERRLARWLLTAHDLAEVNPLPLTQDLLAIMLGVTRPSVSVVLNVLQERKCIALRREQVEIRDRKLLEQNSCACYQALADMRSQQGSQLIA